MRKQTVVGTWSILRLSRSVPYVLPIMCITERGGIYY